MLIFSQIFLSREIHLKISHNLLRASFPNFYNKIMTGRLMNRLSNDIYYIDSLLADSVNLIVAGIVSVFQSLVNYFVNKSYIMLIPICLYIILMLLLIYGYIKSILEITRIEAMSKSPIISYFQEICRGAVFSRTCIKKNYIYFVPN
jgi:ABC-type multidrug transport system fused ATPase/permease subunit